MPSLIQPLKNASQLSQTMAEQKEEPVIDIQESVSKAESYIEENKRSITLIGGVILALVGGYFGFTKLYLAPLEEEAAEKMFAAERYFEKDSLVKAMEGDGKNLGFKAIIDNYGLTSSGNLAHMYLGLCYLHQGKYEEALSELKEYDANDLLLAPIAIGAQGDALAELGKPEEAIDKYIKAADSEVNDFTTPIYYMKAAMLYESQSNFKDALKLYEKIRTDYPETREGREAEKYISRAKALAGVE